MKEEDNSKVYIKYKDKKKIVKLSQKQILNIPDNYCIEDNIEEIIFENICLFYKFNLKVANADTKVIFRNCDINDLVVNNGKVYLTDVNATYIKGINNKSFALKENNEIGMDIKIKAETVLISGNLKEATTEIEAKKVIISSAIIDTFFDFFVRTKKLNIANSEFKSSSILSLDYQQALVTETSFNTHIFTVNGTNYMTEDKKIVISNDTKNNEEYLKSYLWLEFLKRLRDKVKMINKADYKNACKQITEEADKKIKEYKEKINDFELEIQTLQNKINYEEQIKVDKGIEKRKILSKRKIGSIEGVVDKKED